MGKNLAIILLVAGLLLVFSGCQLFTPALSELEIGTRVDDSSKKVIENLDVIDRDVPVIYASVFLRNAPKDTTIKATWQKEEREALEPIEVTTSGSRYVAFTFKKPLEGFRTGEYKIRIEIADTPEFIEKAFTIE